MARARVAADPPAARHPRVRHERVHGRERSATSWSRSTTRLSGHEEVYVVVSGLARFTVGGDEFDAPAGTIVYLPDPEIVRSATSQEDGTTVLAVGGWPDKAFEPSGWEWRFEAEPLSDAGKHEEALAIMEDALEQFGESGPGLYHVARFESRAGHNDDAVAHLRRALELDPELREYAEKDEDLAPLLGEL